MAEIISFADYCETRGADDAMNVRETAKDIVEKVNDAMNRKYNNSEMIASICKAIENHELVEGRIMAFSERNEEVTLDMVKELVNDNECRFKGKRIGVIQCWRGNIGPNAKEYAETHGLKVVEIDK